MKKLLGWAAVASGLWTICRVEPRWTAPILLVIVAFLALLLLAEELKKTVALLMIVAIIASLIWVAMREGWLIR